MTFTQIKKLFRVRYPDGNGLGRYLPYPLRSARIGIDINPFGFWAKPYWNYRPNISEIRKVNGDYIWLFRWLWFQISYSRWL